MEDSHLTYMGFYDDAINGTNWECVCNCDEGYLADGDLLSE